MTEQHLTRQAKRRLAILLHAEEITGNVARTCRYYGMSRQCFYTWKRRYDDHGLDGLRDRSSRPHHSPLATHTDVVGKIVYLRQHYHFGPSKISMYLARYHDISATRLLTHLPRAIALPNILTSPECKCTSSGVVAALSGRGSTARTSPPTVSATSCARTSTLRRAKWSTTPRRCSPTRDPPSHPASGISTCHKDLVPDAHNPDKRHAPDRVHLRPGAALRPIDGRITKHFLEDPTSPTMRSPRRGTSCCTATWVRSRDTSDHGCAEPQLWQDPVPAVDHGLNGHEDIAELKAKLLGSGRTVSQLVSTAWAAAAPYGNTDKRGGANGARLRLEPQRSWAVNEPGDLAKVLPVLEGIQQEFNGAQSGRPTVAR